MFRFSSPARAAAACGLSLILSAGISIPATAVTLPNKDQVRTIRGEDGRTITVSKLDERLRPVVPLAGNSFAHEGFIDLTGRVRLSSKGPRIKSAHLQVGYQVGCQVAITSLTVGGGNDVTLSPSVGRSATNTIGGNTGSHGSITPSISATPSISVTPSVNASAGSQGVGGGLSGTGGVSVTPGVSTTVGGNIGGSAQRSVTRSANLGMPMGHHNNWEATIVPGGVTTVIFADLPFTGYSHAGVKLTNLEFNIASCAGIVSIRSFVRLIYHTPISLDNVTVYGQPRYL